jgi:hypothetical protein
MVGPHFPWLELVIRLGSALVLGFVIGAERHGGSELLDYGRIRLSRLGRRSLSCWRRSGVCKGRRPRGGGQTWRNTQ